MKNCLNVPVLSGRPHFRVGTHLSAFYLRPFRSLAIKSSIADNLAPPPIADPDSAPSTSGTSQPPPLSNNARRAAAPIPQAVLDEISVLGPVNAEGKLFLKALTYEQVEELCVLLGERPSKAKQLFKWVYSDAHWITEFRQATGTPYAMAGKFLDALDSVATLDAGLAFESVTTASDGTRKIIFRLTDGPGRDKTVETVVIPMRSNNRIRHERYTLCVSSQVGCGMNCQFCYTGRMGLMADLLPNQIVGQLVEARRLLAAEGDPSPISHVVYMGMGEPMANYDAMRVSLRLITCPEGLRVGKANVTVSSVGLVPEIQRYATEEESLLAISLHATTDEVRSWLVPVNRRYPLDELTAMLAKHFPRTTPTGGKPDKFCVIEYVMLEGVNDHVDDAERLLRLTDNVYCIINLIQFNAHAGATQFKPSSRERMLLFRDLLKKGGRVSTIRFSKGDDSMAACGQLGNLAMVERPAPVLKPPKSMRGDLEEPVAAPST